MKINLEILDSAYIYAPTQIEELNTKELVPKMVTRRRLTRAAKIAVYLADKVSFDDGRIIYGNSYGEPLSTSSILNSINQKESISPTVFQNSVYNTAVSYFSILTNNKNEIMTISSGDNTSLNILKAGAIKALDGDTILLLAVETLNIENINELNNCIDFLECGVVLKVKITNKDSNIDFIDLSNEQNFPISLIHMINIAQNFNQTRPNIVEILI
ncbi:MAG: beta-ketoacyl synthase chain length factor [Arcobacteraceae bacterium]|nr:beta-ketoacyl synthase chain length factor [Arcobacteraceae bacterium]